MVALVLLIGAALFIGLGAVGLLLWQVSSHQYDDLEGAAARILISEDESKAQPPR